MDAPPAPFPPLILAGDARFSHFGREGGKRGVSAADEGPGDIQTWEVLVPKVPLTNRAPRPFRGKAKCHDRPRP